MLSPMSIVGFFHVHGAATRVGPEETAFGLRQTQWDLNVISQWTEEGESERQIAWTRDVWGRVEPLIRRKAGGSGVVHTMHVFSVSLR